MFQRAYRYLLSLGLLLTGSACRHTAAEPDAHPERADARVEQAATHVWSGELEEARAELVGVLEEFPRHSGALKVQTCVLLELGAPDEAARTVARLQALTPGQPEVEVLSALVEQRRQTPTQGWREALIQAWNRAGRPDLSEGEPFPGYRPDTGSFLEAVWERTQSPEARFTAMLADISGASDAQRQWLAAHVSEIEDPDLLLAAYEHYRPHSGEGASADVRRQAREALRRKLEPLTASASDSEGPLLLLLGESATEAPLTRDDLRALERIAALPRYRRASLAQVSAKVKRRLESAGLTPPASRLFQAAVASQVLDAAWILRKRVDATKEHLSAEDRRGMGWTVFALGERIAASSMLVDRLLGLRQMEQGAELMDDAELLARVKREVEHVQAVARASSSLHVDSWPLPSLQREWLQASLDDEWRSLSALVAP